MIGTTRSRGCLLASFVALSSAACHNSQSDGPPTTAPPTVRALDGSRLGVTGDGAVSVVVFMRKNCPISNRYVPALNDLVKRFGDKGVKLYAVFADPRDTEATVKHHMESYSVPGVPALDPDHQLVDWSGAKVTPEALVLTASGKLIYRGRIDDRYADFGKAKPRASVHDLRDAIERALAGGPTPPFRSTKAVGCHLRDLKKKT